MLNISIRRYFYAKTQEKPLVKPTIEHHFFCICRTFCHSVNAADIFRIDFLFPEKYGSVRRFYFIFSYLRCFHRLFHMRKIQTAKRYAGRQSMRHIHVRCHFYYRTCHKQPSRRYKKTPPACRFRRIRRSLRRKFQKTSVTAFIEGKPFEKGFAPIKSNALRQHRTKHV